MPAIMRLMNKISRCQTLYRTENFPHPEISGCHHAFVLAICHNEGETQEMLAKKLCLNKSTVTRTLLYLEERGFIIRKQNPQDRRALLIYPTEKMLEIYPRVKEISAEWNRKIADRIPEDDLNTFLSVLIKMAESAEKTVFKREEKGL